MPDTLATVILSVQDWDTKPSAELLSAITDPDPVRLPEYSARHTAASLALKFGAAAAEAMVATLRAAGYPVMADSLVARGLDFGHPELQATVDALASVDSETFDAATVVALKSLGVDSRSRWQRVSGAADPTEAEVVAARAAVIAARDDDANRQRWREKFDELFNAHVAAVLDQDEPPTRADMDAAVAACATDFTAWDGEA